MTTQNDAMQAFLDRCLTAAQEANGRVCVAVSDVPEVIVSRVSCALRRLGWRAQMQNFEDCDNGLELEVPDYCRGSLRLGTRVRIKQLVADAGQFAAYSPARREGATGHVESHVRQLIGPAYWVVRHDDGTQASYLDEEIEVPSRRKRRARTCR